MTRKAIRMTMSDFNAAYTWAHNLCLAMLGPVRGEAYFRTLPALDVLEARATRRLPIVAEA